MKRITVIFLVVMLCFNLISPCAYAQSSTRDTSLEQTLASDLKALSLFNGVTDTNFDLTRAPTRTEAVVILIRLLGKDSESQSGVWTQPFNDVAPWADKYIGYAYHEGLTQGVSGTQFGSGNASAATFLTLVLRALGYSDTNGDFSFSDPYTLAENIGLLPERVDTVNFLRTDVVLVSYSALSVKIKGTSQTLAEKLISDGVFTKTQYENYYDANAISRAEASSELSAEQVFTKCSPAVFYIAVYDKSGNVTASGSGFFIDSTGIAVTNYHVIKGSSSAKITVSGTNKVYDVAGIYDYSEEYDWAILKIFGSGFSYLDIGNTDSIIGGATVYAIGSPLGLQNTITSGIVSNASRTEDGVSYIQISAAISHGSSGGALINKFGKVIGITSASYTDGQNLNLALPITYISGYRVSTYENYADFSEESQISFQSSVYNVEIAKGASSTAYIYYNGQNAKRLSAVSSDTSVATVSALTDTSSSGSKKLIITGVKAGKTTVNITDNVKHSIAIEVIVGTDDPISVLEQYVKANGTYDSDDNDYYLGVVKNVDNNKIFYFIDYAPNKTYSLYFTAYTEDDDYVATTRVYVIHSSTAYFDYIFKDKTKGKTTNGSGSILIGSFTPITVVSFGSFTGDQDYEESDASLCSTYLRNSIDAAENIMYQNQIPTNIGDLGFDSLYFNYFCQ